jgi:hypothetical protein
MWLARSTFLPRALVAALLLGSALAGSAAAQTPLTATLSGANEVPGPGSPNGAGTANVTTDLDDVSSLCYDLTVTLDPPATAAHIHRGAADVAGPIVVPFDAPTSGSASGCVLGGDSALIVEIMTNPAGFYVNVHNADFPAGAIRGQLGQ